MLMLEDGVFRFQITDVLCKSVKRGSKTERFIEGIASTQDEDIQKEIIDQRGLDISYLKKAGKLNWKHGGKAGDFIGRIVDAKIKPHGLWIKALLYKGNKTAEDAWNTMSQNSNHGWGFSVEGKVLVRDPFNKRRVKKAAIFNIALTPNPINYSTYADICKALAPGYETNPMAMRDGAAMRAQSLDSSAKITARASLKKKKKKKKRGDGLPDAVSKEVSIMEPSEVLRKALGEDEELETPPEKEPEIQEEPTTGEGNEGNELEKGQGEGAGDDLVTEIEGEENLIDVTPLLKDVAEALGDVDQRGETQDEALGLIQKGLAALLEKQRETDSLVKSIAKELKILEKVPEKRKAETGTETLSKALDGKGGKNGQQQTHEEALRKLDKLYDDGTLAKSLGDADSAANAIIQAETNPAVAKELLEKCAQ